MPLYSYACATHGAFDLLRPIVKAGAPAPCPDCGRAADRTMTVPTVMTMSPVRRMAAARNERSRHEPHVCGAGCSHNHAAPSQRKTRQAKADAAQGAEPKLQSYTGARPWVVEHR
jgi:putative FmdB family regulatory protein